MTRPCVSARQCPKDACNQIVEGSCHWPTTRPPRSRQIFSENSISTELWQRWVLRFTQEPARSNCIESAGPPPIDSWLHGLTVSAPGDAVAREAGDDGHADEERKTRP